MNANKHGCPKESGRAERTSDPPPISYEVPGGMSPRKRGKVEVKVLAEIERGGPDDWHPRQQ